MAEKKLRFETLQIHGGLQPDDPTGARGVAIYPTAAYRFKSCEHAAKLFDLSEEYVVAYCHHALTFSVPNIVEYDSRAASASGRHSRW